MRKIILLTGLFTANLLHAQVAIKSDKDPLWKTLYRPEATKINDLVHTKLDARFDYSKSHLNGKVWITVKPHFYSTDSLLLDAKGMDIHEVAIMSNGKKTPLKYTYDGLYLNITLNRLYKNTENYTVYIDYTAKPDEFESKGSAAITDAKGLYFINPKGEDKSKPTQIWTQGETEGTSVWIPTIDRPNQKCTQEFLLTVPSKYVTLSNGLMTSQKKNTDGTRTDTWKMDLPNSPYLFFMGVGEYSIIKDSYKGKEVSYYVEKEFAPVARKIYGNTPEMMKFYSEKLGVDYPWQKYSQIVGRDYVSGAMENTTATLHQESANQDARQLLDENVWEDVICHELFHHWFGDLVTAESWSNLTVNESFADFSETIWEEYKFGHDAGDEHNYMAMQGYLNSNSDDKTLVRFYYKDKEDMFDAVSYQKGGRILNMLRYYLGEDAFYKGLNKYLTDNKFKNGEAHQLRLAFESVTGQDLNWFWNQWYFNNGHPFVSINYSYDDNAGKASVIIKQTNTGDKFWNLPLAIDVYNGSSKTRYKVWADAKTDTFVFNYTKRPDLINVDGDKIILWEKTDNKTADNFKAQWKYAPLYVDRREALAYFANNKMPELAWGLSDKYAPLRSYTMNRIAEDSAMLADASVLQLIENIAKNDKDRKTKAKALELLGYTGNEKYKALFTQNINDSSYSIAGAALQGLANFDPATAYTYAKNMVNTKGMLADASAAIIMQRGEPADADFIFDHYNEMPVSQEKFQATPAFCAYLAKLSDMSKIKEGITSVVEFRNKIPENYRTFVDPVMKNALDNISEAKGDEIKKYIDSLWK